VEDLINKHRKVSSTSPKRATSPKPDKEVNNTKTPLK
jgi:hypothetical protein